MKAPKRDNAITLVLQLIESIKMADSDREDLRDAVNRISYNSKVVDEYEHMMQGYLIHKKLCRSTSCKNCQLSFENNAYHMPCGEFMGSHPYEAAKILKAWNENDEEAHDKRES